MLDFRIDTFITACKHFNFTNTEEELNITQPAVSQHIKYLEKHYQCKLFIYQGKKMHLSEERYVALYSPIHQVSEIGNLKMIKTLVENDCGISFLYEAAIKEEIKKSDSL